MAFRTAMMVSAIASGVTPGAGVHRKVHSSGRPEPLKVRVWRWSWDPAAGQLLDGQDGHAADAGQTGTDAMADNTGCDGSQMLVRLIVAC